MYKYEKALEKAEKEGRPVDDSIRYYLDAARCFGIDQADQMAKQYAEDAIGCQDRERRLIIMSKIIGILELKDFMDDDLCNDLEEMLRCEERNTGA